ERALLITRVTYRRATAGDHCRFSRAAELACSLLRSDESLCPQVQRAIGKADIGFHTSFVVALGLRLERGVEPATGRHPGCDPQRGRARGTAAAARRAAPRAGA